MENHLNQRGASSEQHEDNYKFIFEDQIHFKRTCSYWSHVLVLNVQRKIWRKFAGEGWD